MRYLMKFAYDGSCFYGYERQNNLLTVQGTIENILTGVNNFKVVKIHSSGRTDRGVHARCQTAHFDLDVKIKPYGLIKLINKECSDIHVFSIENVSDDFHARYSVKSKTYSYYINTGIYDLFARKYVYQYNQKLDIDKMKEACLCLIGEHNFKSFCNDSKSRNNFVRVINSIDITSDDGIIKISINGNGFLRCMVRNIVGVLIEIGSLKRDVSYMNYVLNLCDRKGYIVKSAYSGGLYLDSVFY